MSEQHDEFLPTRRSLLSRLKRLDDQGSWRDFFNTYWKLIYAAAKKAGLTDAEAEDVVQETIITVTKRISALKYDPALGSFKGWLLHITRWRIADQYRKRLPVNPPSAQRTQDDSRRTATIERVPDNFDLDAVWEEDWQKNLVDAAIQRVKQQVSARQYQIFDLYVIKNWPATKVARKLGVSFTRVYLAKHRISALIKKQVEELQKNLV